MLFPIIITNLRDSTSSRFKDFAREARDRSPGSAAGRVNRGHDYFEATSDVFSIRFTALVRPSPFSESPSRPIFQDPENEDHLSSSTRRPTRNGCSTVLQPSQQGRKRKTVLTIVIVYDSCSWDSWYLGNFSSNFLIPPLPFFNFLWRHVQETEPELDLTIAANASDGDAARKHRPHTLGFCFSVRRMQELT